jgi:hypothetical protein
MSALGQKQTLDCCPLMSALPPKADMGDVQEQGNTVAGWQGGKVARWQGSGV